jgi:predicted alpha/beta-hydrolase family hydrolase
MAPAAAKRGLFIGGKSMSGRIATQVAAADSELPVRGLVLLGYPLHPPGQFDKLRDAHLPAIPGQRCSFREAATRSARRPNSSRC